MITPEDIIFDTLEMEDGAIRVFGRYGDIEEWEEVLTPQGVDYMKHLVAMMVMETYINLRYVDRRTGKVQLRHEQRVHNIRKSFFESKLWLD